jgi:secreted PhoX family phosphatase
MPRIWIAVLGLLFALSATMPGALAQSNSYKETNLVSDTAGVPANVDPNLVNPWGTAFFPNNPFWIADNNSGFTTLYNACGMNVGSFPVPAAAANTGQSTCGHSNFREHQPFYQHHFDSAVLCEAEGMW